MAKHVLGKKVQIMSGLVVGRKGFSQPDDAVLERLGNFMRIPPGNTFRCFKQAEGNNREDVCWHGCGNE